MRIFFLLLLFGCFFTAHAQTPKHQPCDENNIYTVQQPYLKKHYDGKLPLPKEWATWPKGKDSIQAFFDKHLHFTVDKSEPIQRVIMELVVDCNGVPGQFNITSNGGYPIEAELLAICRTEMKEWIPAQHKKGAVDCRQVLIFSIANGRTKVKYIVER